MATDVNMHFCDPRSLWQRGTNENANDLLRGYFLRGMTLLYYSQQDVDAIPFKAQYTAKKNSMTPGAKLAESVATTG